MDTDFELYKGKSFKELCRDIYANHENRKNQVETLIGELKPLIKTVNDAMIVVPLIKEYIDAGNTNDEHLVKLASIIQKLITAQSQSESSGPGSSLTEEEKKQLWGEIEKIQNSDSIIVKEIKKD